MLSIDFTFLWTAVNLIVLYLFLRKFLFGKVTAFMESRTEAIRADLEQGASQKAEGERCRKEHAALLKDASAERARILDEARKRAEAESAAMVAEARKQASGILSAARADAGQEKERAMSQMRDEVASLALAAASKVIAANMDSDQNRRLVSEMLNNMEKDEAAS